MSELSEEDFLAERFETHRTHLRAVAYRMLGSISEADDAVQEAWLRLSRSDPGAIDNLGGWLTTVVSRVCLNVLRSRRNRHDEPAGAHIPDPIVLPIDARGPEDDAVLADSVSLALLVVLETLAPAERLAFVLHDIFAVPFDEIAPMVGKSSQATRQLASRARRRVRGPATGSDTGLAHQREVVDAFFAAARHGDFEALVAVLDPDVVARHDAGGRPFVNQGAERVARQAVRFSRPAANLRPALVNGAAGMVVVEDNEPFAVMGFTVQGGRITAIDGITDTDRLAALDLEPFLE